MLGLKKCKEEDFHQFTYSNWRYDPEDFDGFLFGLLIGIFVFGGIGYCYLSAVEIQNKNIINKVCIAFLVISLLIFGMVRINKKKYAYKFQKVMILVLGLYWFIMAFIMYPMPLILGIAEHHTLIVQAVICTASIGFVYLIVVFIKLIYLIRKGQMRKGCGGLYERLVSSKVAGGAGVLSVPAIVMSGRMARNVTKAMDSSGNSAGPLVLMLIFGFIINIIFCTYFPELIILAYCKFRFESFNIPGDPWERKRIFERERKRERREHRIKQREKQLEENRRRKILEQKEGENSSEPKSKK